MEDFKPGDVIKGKYEVTKVLGKGGMGYVVAALLRAGERDPLGQVSAKGLR